MAVSITLGRGEHAAVFGRTGTGKTVLGKRLLAEVAPFVVFDAKHTFTLPGVPIVDVFDKRLDRQIIRFREYGNEYEETEHEVARIWDLGGPRTIYFDETHAHMKGTRLPAMVERVLRQGRERQLSAICVTQRPTFIPSIVFTEATHFFVFHLSFSRDREKVVAFTADEMAGAMNKLRKHDFVYYNVLSSSVILVRQ